MSIVQQNFLSPVEFKFVIHRLPNVAFFVQQVNIPGLTTGVTEQPNPFKVIYRHGDKVDFDDLEVIVRVDENMETYKEIFNWIVGLTKPHNFSEYANLVEGDGLYSDATLYIMNSNKNANIQIEFKDIFPTSLGQIQMDTTSSDIVYPTTTITFKTNGMEIAKL